MKIWQGFGSEHSAKLRLVGTFKTVADAQRVNEDVNSLQAMVLKHENEILSQPDKYPEEILHALSRQIRGGASIHPKDLEDFFMFEGFEQNGNQLIMETDDEGWAGLIKLFVNNEAKVEVFSRHFYPA